MNANRQIDMACDKIKNDAKLANGYHAVGFSQGGQFLFVNFMIYYYLNVIY